jgi:hypothetical protein
MEGEVARGGRRVSGGRDNRCGLAGGEEGRGRNGIGQAGCGWIRVENGNRQRMQHGGGIRLKAWPTLLITSWCHLWNSSIDYSRSVACSGISYFNLSLTSNHKRYEEGDGLCWKLCPIKAWTCHPEIGNLILKVFSRQVSDRFLNFDCHVLRARSFKSSIVEIHTFNLKWAIGICSQRSHRLLFSN